MKIIYTNSDLVNILPLREYRFCECGIDETNIVQIFCKEKNNTFLFIKDEVLFNEKLINKSLISYLTKEEFNIKVNELQDIKDSEQENTLTLEKEVREQANKISILECENKALKEELTQIQTSIASLTSLITTLEEK